MSSLTGRTIVMIAAGGDASRFLLPAYSERFSLSTQAPMWYQDVCFPSERLPGQGDFTFLDFAILNVLKVQHQAKAEIPIAVVVGPNTQRPIERLLSRFAPSLGDMLQMITQASQPVLDSEGQPLYWENGEPICAPDGTAGCLQALASSPWYKRQVEKGFTFVYCWNINDLGGSKLKEHLENVEFGDQPIRWICDDRGIAVMDKLSGVWASEHPELVLALEDTPSILIVDGTRANELLQVVDLHIVYRNVPILGADGQFVKAGKREKFLSDLVRKSHLFDPAQKLEGNTTLKPGDTALGRLRLERIEQTPTAAIHVFSDIITNETVRMDLSAKESESRESQFTRNVARELERNPEEKGLFTTNIGQKAPGDYLVSTYRIERILRGGFGIIYVCKDEENGALIVAKTYHDEIRWGSPGLVRRFWHEANQWICLPKHPNITEAIIVCEIDGRLHLLLEYVSGGNLRSRLLASPIDKNECLKIGLGILAGLSVIHRAGIIHRDLKPENILISKEGISKITDLGLATIPHNDANDLAGTPGYMAPEQVVGSAPVDSRVDIYSTGVILYELLTGFRPLRRPAHIGRLRPDLTRACSEMVMACLAESPGSRPTVTEMVQTLASDLGRPYSEPVTEEREPSIDHARSLTALGRYDDAIKAVDALLEATDRKRACSYCKALVLYQARKYKECAAVCLPIFEMPIDRRSGHPSNEDVSSVLDMCSVRLGARVGDPEDWTNRAFIVAHGHGDSRMAMELADVALKLEPANGHARLLKAQCLYNLGHYEQAISCVQNFTSPELDQPMRNLEEACRSILEGNVVEPFRFQQYIEAAKGFVRSAEYSEAARHYKAALEIQPDDPDALSGLAAVITELGQPAEALRLFELAFKVNQSDEIAWYNHGRLLLLLGRFREGIDSFQRSIQIAPDFDKPWTNKGVCLLQTGLVSEALNCFERAIELNPNSESARAGLEACKQANQNLESHVVHESDYWLVQCSEHAAKGRYREALACCRTALELDPSSLTALYNIAYFLWMLGQYSAAVEHCDQVLRVDPMHVHAWNIRGNALDDLGQTQDALGCYERAVEADDNYYEAWNGKGICLDKAGRYKEAIACFEKACSINPQFGRGWFGRASALSKMGLHREAIESYDRAIALNANHPNAWFGKGCELHKLHLFEEAEDAYEKALESNPTDYEAWGNLGSLHLECGHVGDAIPCLRRALELRPQFDIAWRNLERALAMAALAREGT